MYSNTYYESVDKDNPFENLLTFMIIKHVLNNGKYIADLANKRDNFRETLMNMRN